MYIHWPLSTFKSLPVIYLQLVFLSQYFWSFFFFGVITFHNIYRPVVDVNRKFPSFLPLPKTFLSFFFVFINEIIRFLIVVENWMGNKDNKVPWVEVLVIIKRRHSFLIHKFWIKVWTIGLTSFLLLEWMNAKFCSEIINLNFRYTIIRKDLVTLLFPLCSTSYTEYFFYQIMMKPEQHKGPSK